MEKLKQQIIVYSLKLNSNLNFFFFIKIINNIFICGFAYNNFVCLFMYIFALKNIK